MEEPGKSFKIRDLLDKLKEFYTVQNVFGEPIEIKGRTIIPVARIASGASGGGGEGPAPEGNGGEEPGARSASETGGVGGYGMGFIFGGAARPAGILVLEDGDTRWIPITDSERIILKSLAAAVSLLKIKGRMAARGRKKA